MCNMSILSVIYFHTKQEVTGTLLIRMLPVACDRAKSCSTDQQILHPSLNLKIPNYGGRAPICNWSLFCTREMQSTSYDIPDVKPDVYLDCSSHSRNQPKFRPCMTLHNIVTYTRWVVWLITLRGFGWLPDLFAMEITATTQIAITANTLALVASQITLTELHCTDISLQGLTDEDWLTPKTDQRKTNFGDRLA
jgi:hypothetical protein